MTGDDVRRLTAGIGLSAVVATVAGWLLLPGDLPNSMATPEQVVRWTLDDRRNLLVGSVLVAAALVLAIAFFAGLRALCARAEGAPGLLATIGYGSMLVGLGIGFVGVALAQTQAFVVLNGDPATVKAFHEARLLTVNIAGLPVGVGFLAFGAGMVRTRFPARSLGYAAALAALAQFLGVVALSQTGFFSPSGGAALVGAVAFSLWIALASVTLFRRSSGPAARRST
jgi:hypothetical protein